MAFNPFHSFRKHQKVILAVVTIMIMFIFVLSSGVGKGDFFNQLASWFSSRRPSPPVITLYGGDKVTEKDLDQLRFQRELANVFMRMAILQGQVAFLKEAKGAVNRFPNEWKFRLQDVVTSTEELYKLREVDPRFIQKQYDDYRRALPFRLQGVKEALRHNPGEAEFLRKLAMMLLHQTWMMSSNRGDFYFAGSTKADDLLDFMVWKRQADQLGISLTDKDLRAEINNQTLSRETLTGDTQRDLSQLSTLLRGQYGDLSGVPLDRFYAALRDELRVSIAQSALLGYQGGVQGMLDDFLGVNRVPAAVTPDQFWNYYVDNRTTLKVSLLPVPVKAFLPQVTGTPGEEELRALFREYKAVEPNPDSDTPGFRQPRRVQVQWVSARADSPHYEKLGRERNAAVVASVVGDRWFVLGLVERLHQDYRFQQFRHRNSYLLPAWTETTFPLAFATSLNRAENVTATVGALASAGTHGSPLAALTGYQAAAYVRDAPKLAPFVAQEARERTPLAATFVLAGSQRGLLPTLATVAGLYDHGSKAERNLPLNAVAGEMIERMQGQQAQSQVTDSLQKVAKEVESWRGKSPQEAAAGLTKLVEEHGLMTGGTHKLRDRHDIDEDEGMKEFRAAIVGGQPKEEQARLKIAPLFFTAETPPYSPRDLPTMEGIFIYWKTENVAERTYASYADAPEDIKERVREAWRMQKARALARQAIEQVQATAQTYKNADDAVRFLRDEGKKNGWNEVFDLDGIARLVESKAAVPAPKTYEPYRPPEDKINARPGFADDLLRMLKVPGDVTVVWNRPETIYYLAVLERREEPTEEDFMKVFRKAGGDDLMIDRDNLLERFEAEQRQKFSQARMEDLRKEAQGNDNGEWVLDAEVRKRFEGRGRDSGD